MQEIPFSEKFYNNLRRYGGAPGSEVISFQLELELAATLKSAAPEIHFSFPEALRAVGVSTQLQSSGLVAHENSTFRNLALAVSGPFMA